MTAALFLVIMAILLGLFNFKRLHKSIERILIRTSLDEIKKDIPMYEEKQKTFNKVKKVKGKYND